MLCGFHLRVQLPARELLQGTLFFKLLKYAKLDILNHIYLYVQCNNNLYIESEIVDRICMAIQEQVLNRLLKYCFVDKTCFEYKNYLKKKIFTNI